MICKVNNMPKKSVNKIIFSPNLAMFEYVDSLLNVKCEEKNTIIKDVVDIKEEEPKETSLDKIIITKDIPNKILIINKKDSGKEIKSKYCEQDINIITMLEKSFSPVYCLPPLKKLKDFESVKAVVNE